MKNKNQPKKVLLLIGIIFFLPLLIPAEAVLHNLLTEDETSFSPLKRIKIKSIEEDGDLSYQNGKVQTKAGNNDSLVVQIKAKNKIIKAISSFLLLSLTPLRKKTLSKEISPISLKAISEKVLFTIDYNTSNFTDIVVAGQTRYGDIVGTPASTNTANPPTFAQSIYSASSSNFTSLGYFRVNASDNAYANITSDGTNEEPMGFANITINIPIDHILWINISLEQNQLAATDGACNYYRANWTSGTFGIFGATMTGTTDVLRSFNYSGVNLTDIVESGSGRLTILTGGQQSDANEGCRIDSFNARVGYFDNPANWSNNQTNSTTSGTAILHSVLWDDDIQLSGYIFSFDNGTGSFTNDSWVGFTGTTNWSNVTKVVNFTEGSTIKWRVYANDTSGNLNVTSNFQYTTTAAPTDSCSCPGANQDWSIINADQCVLSTSCNLGTGKFRIWDGSLKITSAGGLNANGCFVKDAEYLLVIDGGDLICR